MNAFFKKFFLDAQPKFEPVLIDFFGRDDVAAFVSKYSGCSFNQGIYRLHSAGQIVLWDNVISAIFPQYQDSIRCFGYDWLGRQFAIVNENETQVLMLDADTGEVLEIPVTFDDFHNVELVQYGNDALAETAFNEWIATQNAPLKLSECVSFEIPLHLGGKDEMSNRERVDMGVHWELSAQVLDQTKPLKDGQRIEAIKLIGNGSAEEKGSD